MKNQTNKISQRDVDSAISFAIDKFKIIADNSYSWEAWCGVDNCLHYVSPAFERITGYNVEQYMNDPELIKRIIHPADILKYEAHLNEANSRRDAYKIDFRIITKEGDEKTIRHFCKAVYDELGNYLGRRESNIELEDISEKKNTETNLKINSLFSGIIIVDENQKVISFNDLVVEMWELDTNIIESMKLDKLAEYCAAKIVNPDVIYKLLNFNESNRMQIVDDNLHFESGKVYNMTVSPLLSDQNDLIGRIIEFKDVTNYQKVTKKLEHEALEKEHIFRAITTSAKDAIVLVDEDAKIKFWNHAAEKMFGYKTEEITGKDLHSLIAPERYFELIQKGMAEFKRTGGGNAIGKTLQLTGLKKDKTEFPVGLSLSSFKIGNRWNAVGIIRDMSEWKKIETELRKLGRAVEQSPSSLIITDKDGIIEYVNPKFVEMTGYSPDDVRGKHPGELKRNMMPEKEFEELWKTITSGKKWNGEILYKDKQGKDAWGAAYITPVFDSDGNIKNYLAAINDITEKKLIEEKLAKSEKQFRHIYENSTLGIYRSTPEGQIILANPSFLSMLGYNSFEELKDINAKGLYADASVRNDFEQIVNSEGVVYGFETQLYRKDGIIIDVAINAKKIKDQFNNKEFYEGTIEDITIRKDAERALINAKERAEEMNKVKTSLLNNMSHELRTPLIGITGYAELLQEQLEDEEQKQMVKNILVSGKRLTNTLNEIMDLAMFESSTMEKKLRVVNINNELQTVVSSYKANAKDKGLDFKFIKGNPKIFANINVTLFNRAIGYLLDNAIKFTNSGSVEVLVFSADNVIIQINDTGIGIPEEKLKVIFEPFRQASEGFGRHFEGSGLGLSLAKKFIESFDGSISIKSKVDLGTTITVELPKPVQ